MIYLLIYYSICIGKVKYGNMSNNLIGKHKYSIINPALGWWNWYTR